MGHAHDDKIREKAKTPGPSAFSSCGMMIARAHSEAASLAPRNFDLSFSRAFMWSNDLGPKLVHRCLPPLPHNQHTRARVRVRVRVRVGLDSMDPGECKLYRLVKLQFAHCEP